MGKPGQSFSGHEKGRGFCMKQAVTHLGVRIRNRPDLLSSRTGLSPVLLTEQFSSVAGRYACSTPQPWITFLQPNETSVRMTFQRQQVAP